MPRAQSAQTLKSSQNTPYDSKPTKPKAAASQKVSWTDEQDRIIVAHVLARSKIDIHFDWPELIKESFPDLKPKQIQNHWEKKVKPALFPNLTSTTKGKSSAGGAGGGGQKKGGAKKAKELVLKHEDTDDEDEEALFDEEDED